MGLGLIQPRSNSLSTRDIIFSTTSISAPGNWAGGSSSNPGRARGHIWKSSFLFRHWFRRRILRTGSLQAVKGIDALAANLPLRKHGDRPSLLGFFLIDRAGAGAV